MARHVALCEALEPRSFLSGVAPTEPSWQDANGMAAIMVETKPAKVRPKPSPAGTLTGTMRTRLFGTYFMTDRPVIDIIKTGGNKFEARIQPGSAMDITTGYTVFRGKLNGRTLVLVGKTLGHSQIPGFETPIGGGYKQTLKVVSPDGRWGKNIKATFTASVGQFSEVWSGTLSRIH